MFWENTALRGKLKLYRSSSSRTNGKRTDDRARSNDLRYEDVCLDFQHNDVVHEIGYRDGDQLLGYLLNAETQCFYRREEWETRCETRFENELALCRSEIASRSRGLPFQDGKDSRVMKTFTENPLTEWDCEDIVNAETRYDEPNNEECYLEVCQSLAVQRRNTLSFMAGTCSRDDGDTNQMAPISKDQLRQALALMVPRKGILEEWLIDPIVEVLQAILPSPREKLASSAACGPWASKAPHKGPYERKTDSMIERAECSTLSGTPHAATCKPWDDEWDEHGIARKGIAKQGSAAIMYGGMENYDNYTAGIEDRQRIRSAKHWEKSRVNPIEEPCWWSDGWGRILRNEDGTIRCGCRYIKIYDKNGVGKEEVEELDWSWWAEKLTWAYDEKVTISHAGNGSVERLRAEVNNPREDVWRRGCPCQKPVANYEIGIGGWNVFDGPSWVFWDIVTTWTAILLMFVYWEWVVGWKLRTSQDAARHRKEGRRRTSKLKIA